MNIITLIIIYGLTAIIYKLSFPETDMIIPFYLILSSLLFVYFSQIFTLSRLANRIKWFRTCPYCNKVYKLSFVSKTSFKQKEQRAIKKKMRTDKDKLYKSPRAWTYLFVSCSVWASLILSINLLVENIISRFIILGYVLVHEFGINNNRKKFLKWVSDGRRN